MADLPGVRSDPSQYGGISAGIGRSFQPAPGRLCPPLSLAWPQPGLPPVPQTLVGLEKTSQDGKLSANASPCPDDEWTLFFFLRLSWQTQCSTRLLQFNCLAFVPYHIEQGFPITC